MSRLAEAQAFVAELRRDIPLAAFMDLQAAAWDGRELTLRVPLEPNLNDKGTAFAGSLASLSTVTGWALLMLWAREHVGPCQVAVYQGALRYRHPVRDGFSATAVLPDRDVMANLAARLASRGRGRVDIDIQLASEGRVSVLQMAGYAIWRVEPDD